MKITILTLFPDMFKGPLSESIIKLAQAKKLIEISLINIRDFGVGSHKTTDEKPYGGGVGMLLRVDVVEKAIQSAKDPNLSPDQQIVLLLDADGETFTQKRAQELSRIKHLILVCGHYEGIDDRIKEFVDGQISIGDFIVTGGEIPAMLIADAVIRLIPDVLKESATKFESFSPELSPDSLRLEYPHYTRPQIYKNKKVPEVLISGDHKKIEQWRKENSPKKPIGQTKRRTRLDSVDPRRTKIEKN